VVFPDLQGKGPVRQRSIPADLIFCFFFIKKKEEGLRGPSGASQARKASPCDKCRRIYQNPDLEIAP